MEVVINDEAIQAMVREEADKAIRRRIKEMQSGYTCKEYIEEVMRKVLWDTICEKIPNMELYLMSKIDELIEHKRKQMDVPKKSEVIEYIVDALEHEF